MESYPRTVTISYSCILSASAPGTGTTSVSNADCRKRNQPKRATTAAMPTPKTTFGTMSMPSIVVSVFEASM